LDFDAIYDSVLRLKTWDSSFERLVEIIARIKTTLRLVRFVHASYPGLPFLPFLFFSLLFFQFLMTVFPARITHTRAKTMVYSTPLFTLYSMRALSVGAYAYSILYRMARSFHPLKKG